MKITKEQIIEQIIEQSQLPREIVLKEFDQFIAESSGVVKGSPLTIEEMGVFRLKKGRLSFETDSKLALEINYKYAGMLPIEVKKGQSHSAQDDEPQVERTQTGKTTNDVEEEDEIVQIGKVREPQKEKPIVEEPKTDDIKQEVVPEESVHIEKTASTESETLVESAKNEEAKPELVEIAKEEKQTQVVKEKAEKPVDVKKPSPKSRSPKKENDSTMTYATIVAAIIIVAAIVWFMNSKPVQVNEPLSENTEVKPAVKAEEKKQTAEKPNMEKPEETKVLKETQDQFEGKSDGVYKEGLKDIQIKGGPKAKNAEIVQDIVNQLQESTNPSVALEPTVYYTAVIYTLSYKQRAEQEVESLKKKGFDAFVKSFRTKSNEDRFYVCIGKLASYSEAKEFAEAKLPEPFNSKFAVKRLTD